MHAEPGKRARQCSYRNGGSGDPPREGLCPRFRGSICIGCRQKAHETVVGARFAKNDQKNEEIAEKSTLRRLRARRSAIACGTPGQNALAWLRAAKSWLRGDDPAFRDCCWRFQNLFHWLREEKKWVIEATEEVAIRRGSDTN